MTRIALIAATGLMFAACTAPQKVLTPSGYPEVFLSGTSQRQAESLLHEVMVSKGWRRAAYRNIPAVPSYQGAGVKAYQTAPSFAQSFLLTLNENLSDGRSRLWRHEPVGLVAFRFRSHPDGIKITASPYLLCGEDAVHDRVRCDQSFANNKTHNQLHKILQGISGTVPLRRPE